MVHFTGTLEQHPFPAVFIPDEVCHTLVLGSFPPPVARHHYPFFYPNLTNKFWDTIHKVIKSRQPFGDLLKPSLQASEAEKLAAIAQRKEMCRLIGFGISDIVKRCFRQKGTAKDEELLVAEYMPTLQLLDKHPSIKRIVLTGKSGSSGVHFHFYTYLTQNNIPFSYAADGPMIKGHFTTANKTIQVYSLPSTSARNGGNFDLVKLYTEALC